MQSITQRFGKSFWQNQKLYPYYFSWTILTLLVTPLSTSLSTICYGILAISALYQINAQHRWHLLFTHPLTRFFWIGACLVIVGVCYSTSPLNLSLITAKKYLWFFITPLLIVSMDNHHTQKEMRKIYSLYLCVIGVGVFLSYYRFFYHVGNPDLVFKDHIIQSLLLSLALAISVHRFFNTSNKVVYASFSVILMINILFINDGRTGYILLPLIIIYAIWTQYPNKKVWLPILASLFILLPTFFFSPAIQKRWDDIVHSAKSFQTQTEHQSSLGVRLHNWQIGFQLFRERPLLGHGTGGIQKSFEAYLSKHPSPTVTHVYYKKHKKIEIKSKIITPDKLLDSSYLNFMVQYGVLGIGFCFYFFIGLWRASKRCMPFDKYLARMILLSFMAIIWINPWFSSSAPTHLVSVLFALLYSAKNKPIE